jgi:hypothetical protein
LQKHGNKTKEGSGCFATAASEGTFAEYIIGIHTREHTRGRFTRGHTLNKR